MKHAAAVHRGRPSTSWPRTGFRRVVGLVLAPHYSAFSVGQYLDRLDRRGHSARHRRRRHPQLGDRAGLRRLHRRRCARPLGGDAGRARRVAVHRALAAAADPRRPATRTRRAARRRPRRVADARSGLRATGASPGRAPGARRSRGCGPTSCTVIDDLGSRRPHGGLLVSAVGFVADHLEVLYDLDIEAAAPGRRARPGVRPHRMRQRRPGGDGGAGRPHRRRAS